MGDGFVLDRPVYTPREVATIYSHYVRSVSYATVLQWVQLFRVTDGEDGIDAGKTPGGHYLVTAEELGRVLVKAGAVRGGDSERGSHPSPPAGPDAA